MEAAQLGEPKSKKATSKSRINTDILYIRTRNQERNSENSNETKKALKIVTEIGES